MKISSSIVFAATMILAVSTPLMVVASEEVSASASSATNLMKMTKQGEGSMIRHGLGGRKLDEIPSGFKNPGPGSCTGLFKPPCDTLRGRQDSTNPTLDQLNELYGTFCEVCNFVDTFQIDTLLGVDAGLCVLVCDIITEIPDPNDIATTSCFSELSTVQVLLAENNNKNSIVVPMKDLSIGDRILTQNGSFEPVYAFGHYNPSKMTEFLQFQITTTTAGSKTKSLLEMTGGHLVFLEGKKNPVRADSIKVGGTLEAATGPAKITKIRTVTRKGVYSPLTPSGTVVVEGIVASTYISLQKDGDNIEFVQFNGGFSLPFLSYQNFIHMALSPYRMLTMGISSTLGNDAYYTPDGIPLFVAYSIDLAKWADTQNILVQGILFLAFGVIAGSFMFIETTFGGPTFAPFVVAAAVGAAAGVYALTKKKNYGIYFRAHKNKMKSV